MPENEIIQNGNICIYHILESLRPGDLNIEHTKKDCSGINPQCEYYIPQKDIYQAEKGLSKTGL